MKLRWFKILEEWEDYKLQYWNKEWECWCDVPVIVASKEEELEAFNNEYYKINE